MTISCRRPELTRQRLANPHLEQRLEGLLSQARCIDLRGNFAIQDLGAGYARMVAIDPSRRWGDSAV